MFLGTLETLNMQSTVKNKKKYMLERTLWLQIQNKQNLLIRWN